jgi:zinc transport system substrate-binding protein
MESWAMRAIRALLPAILLALTLLLAACGGSGGSGKPVVITSFYPLYYFASQIAGDRMEVRNLVPAGAEPHDWEPKARDVADITKAAVLIYNGAGLEHWVDATLESAKSDRRVDIKATEGLTLLPPPPGEEGQTMTNDPHVWLDPTLAREVARKIADGLIKADPAGQAIYEQNLAALIAKLDGLDTQYKDGLRTCDRREIITSHAAFGYLARRYGLEQIAVEGLAPDAEPTPARLAEVTKIARERNAGYIFFETLVSPKVAEAVANEIGAQTLVLDPLEGVKDEKTQTYFTVMGDNLANLRTALGCR